jgi:hypothetical protein
MPPKSFFNIKKKDIDTSIVIKDIDPDALDKDYNIKEYLTSKQSNSNSFISSKKTTRYNKKNTDSKALENPTIDIQLENLGLTKEQKKYEPTVAKVADISTKNGPKIVLNFNKSSLNNEECSNLHCWWCRYSIPNDVQVLGCPLRFAEETFICEGSFCSFNCIKAYIEDKNHYNMKYRESISLTILYYSKIFNLTISYSNIFTAPHWSLLKNYGGNLSIEEFRNEFQRIEYYGPTGSLIRDITKPLKNAFTFVERK